MRNHRRHTRDGAREGGAGEGGAREGDTVILQYINSIRHVDSNDEPPDIVYSDGD